MDERRGDLQEHPATHAAAQARAVRVMGCPLPKWARRVGLAAFVFFLVKGLLWLLVPAAVVWWGSR
jgi:hypothetical protein